MEKPTKADIDTALDSIKVYTEEESALQTFKTALEMENNSAQKAITLNKYIIDLIEKRQKELDDTDS